MLNADPENLLKPLETNDETSARIQVAAMCRLIEHYGWSDVILNHVSARVPGEPQQFLMNPFGLCYGEVCASNLVKVDFVGNTIGKPEWPVNVAGVMLHSAIYEARPDIHAAIHTHTEYGVAVSMLENGLLCHDQMSMLFHHHVGYHDFEGIVAYPDEKQRIKKALAQNKCLILRNHGLVAVGASIAEAFWNYYYLEFACRVQIHAMSTGANINKVVESIKDNTFNQHEFFCKEKAPTVQKEFPGNIDLMFGALMRMLDKKDNSYRE